MRLMNVHEKILDETICVIWNIVRFKYTSLIAVKKIRNLYKIKPRDCSKINFSWRNLQVLEQTGILKMNESKKPKNYQVLNFFKFIERFLILALIEVKN